MSQFSFKSNTTLSEKECSPRLHSVHAEILHYRPLYLGNMRCDARYESSDSPDPKKLPRHVRRLPLRHRRAWQDQIAVLFAMATSTAKALRRVMSGAYATSLKISYLPTANFFAGSIL